MGGDARDVDDEAEVVRREMQLLAPTTRRSSDAVDRLLHPDFYEFGSSGEIWDRASIVELLTQSAPEDVIETADLKPVRLSADVILLTYRTVHPQGSALRSSTWVRLSGEWRLRFHHGTPSA